MPFYEWPVNTQPDLFRERHVVKCVKYGLPSWTWIDSILLWASFRNSENPIPFICTKSSRVAMMRMVKILKIARLFPDALLTLKWLSFPLPYNIHMLACVFCLFAFFCFFFLTSRVLLYTALFLVFYKDSGSFLPPSFFLVSINRICTSFVFLPVFSPAKTFSFLQGPSHRAPTLVCLIVSVPLPGECGLFPWKCHRTLFFA